MVRLLGRKIPNIYIIGALLLFAASRPARFTEATGAVGTLGDTLTSIGQGSTQLIRGILPFSELGTEFTDFSGGLNSLLDPFERLIDIGGRLIPFNVTPPIAQGGGGQILSLPPDEPVPPGTPTPRVEIYGEVY
jgi:hypothetical protein